MPHPHWCHEGSHYLSISNGPCKKREYFHLTVHGVSTTYGVPAGEPRYRCNHVWLAFMQGYGDPEEVEPEWLTLDGAPVVFVSCDVAKNMALLCRPGVALGHGLAWLRPDGSTEDELSYDLVRRRMELGWPLERLLDPPQRTSKPAA